MTHYLMVDFIEKALFGKEKIFSSRSEASERVQ